MSLGLACQVTVGVKETHMELTLLTSIMAAVKKRKIDVECHVFQREKK